MECLWPYCLCGARNSLQTCFSYRRAGRQGVGQRLVVAAITASGHTGARWTCGVIFCDEAPPGSWFDWSTAAERPAVRDRFRRCKRRTPFCSERRSSARGLLLRGVVGETKINSRYVGSFVRSTVGDFCQQ